MAYEPYAMGPNDPSAWEEQADAIAQRRIDLPAGEKLDLLTTETTEAILPNVQTGRLAEGYAASFLVFREKPFESGRWVKPRFVYLNGERVAENDPAGE